MFMSTLYKKRPEPTSKQKLLFTVDDSLVKLFEYLTLEFSCRKLITPKWKDFRSQKLQFDQKTRLNNAIWRGWHIQYKMKKKARFFQFAAPFSDESVHSTSQAVILDGKYWKRRLDRVTRKFKKWRKFLYKEKLLKNCTTKKEDLEDSDEEIFEVDDKEKNNDNSKVSDVLDIEDPSTLNGSAMYALSDTLFSSVGTDKLKPFEDSFLSFYKDSSVMIQPTIDHLNPCFDELMENFDFLFSDCSTIPPVDIIHSGDMLSSNVSYDDSSSQSFGNSYFSMHNSKTLETDGRYSLNEHFNSTKNSFPQSLGNKGMLLKNSCMHDSLKGSFQDLPPQLQAPNLTAHLQSVMLSKTPVNLKISSESSVAHTKRTASQVENASLPQKKSRRKKSLSESNDSVSVNPSQSSYLQKLSTHIQPKSSFSIPDNNVAINSNIGKNQEHSNFICDSSSSFQQSNYTLQPTSSTSQNCNVKTQNQENIITPVINDQQLLTLATLLQCSQPTQSTEATLAYLELLQQQVQLLVKQQQEQLQMKYQIQQHSERVIKQHEYNLQPIEQSVPDCMLQHQSHSTYLQQNPQIHQHRQSVIGSTLGNQTIMNACPLKDLSSEETIATYKFTKSASLNKTVSLLENKNSTVKISNQNSLKKSLHCKLDIKPSESTFCNAAVSYNESCTPKYSTVISPDQHMGDMSKSPFNNVNWNSYEKEQWKPPTTLDSAIALVALRDGAPSMNSYYNLHHTTTVQSSDISSSLRQSNEKLPKIIEEEQKRKLHLTAEQKRRSIIKNAFEDLAALLPTSKDTNQANKLTNASILQKTCDYVNELQQKKKAHEFRINQLKQEIEQYKISITECQNKIPELSSSELLPQKASDSVEKDFVAFCKELIYANPKSWIFCQIMRPLFNSYNSTVATKTVDQFVSSVMTWFEKYFMLSAIRTIVLNTLTKLSTSTSLLDDPSCLIELVNVAVRENDPTLIPSISTKR